MAVSSALNKDVTVKKLSGLVSQTAKDGKKRKMKPFTGGLAKEVKFKSKS